METTSVDFNTALAVAFSAWSLVMGWLGFAIIRRLDKYSGALQQYIVQTEARLAVVEDRLKINHPDGGRQ